MNSLSLQQLALFTHLDSILSGHLEPCNDEEIYLKKAFDALVVAIAHPTENLHRYSTKHYNIEFHRKYKQLHNFLVRYYRQVVLFMTQPIVNIHCGMIPCVQEQLKRYQEESRFLNEKLKMCLYEKDVRELHAPSFVSV
jgi:hypothetical protein